MINFFTSTLQQQSTQVEETGEAFFIATIAQSNGRATTGTDAYSQYTFPNGGCYYFNDQSDTFVLYDQDQIIGRYIRSFHPSNDGHWGPGLAHHWRQLRGDTVCVAATARGGAPMTMNAYDDSTIFGVWSADYTSSHPTYNSALAHFDNLKSTIGAAILNAQTAGDVDVDKLDGIIVYQGENDAGGVVAQQWMIWYDAESHPNAAINTNYGGGAPPLDPNSLQANSVYQTELQNCIDTLRTYLAGQYPSFAAHYAQLPVVIVRTGFRQSQVDAYNQYQIDSIRTDDYYRYLGTIETQLAQSAIASGDANAYVITLSDNFPDPLPGGGSGGGNYYDGEVHYSQATHDNILGPAIAQQFYDHYYG